MRFPRTRAAVLASAVIATGLAVAVVQPSIAGAGSGDKCIDFDVKYTDGTRDVGTFCGGNTVTRVDVPTLQAISLHISCSDDLLAPTKSDLGLRTVQTWSVVKSGDKICGSVTSSTGTSTKVEKDKAAEKADKAAEKAAKEAAEKAAKAQKEAAKAAEKEAKAQREAAEDAEKAAKKAAEKAEKSAKKQKCITYDVRYTDGTSDAGEFCGGNNITRVDEPGLDAISIHISCSDDLYNPTKSDLAGKTVSYYRIIKGNNICGDPATPPPSAPVVVVEFTCETAMVSSTGPIENSTVVYDDGTSRYIWGQGRTSYTVTAPAGRFITALWVDGVAHHSDAVSGGGSTDQPSSSCYHS